MSGGDGHNFWWIEVGGLKDTIRDAEPIRDELMRIAYGVVDYIKNYSPEREQAANLAVEWIGSLPGKRENRRYLGDHVLTQNDISSGGHFDDIVAYGGWSMDDHHPAGIYYPGEPTIFHPAPSPYGIPFGCLYSRNVGNLLFAGRNISVTHAALSSTRVMGTCALLGQAAGSAAALCVRRDETPRALRSGSGLRELQRVLMDDDCWLPGVTRPVSPLAASAAISGCGDGVVHLIDGVDRDLLDASHSWTGCLGSEIEYRWDDIARIDGVRLVFDSNLAHEKRMPHSYPQNAGRSRVPGSLVRRYRIEALDRKGQWVVVFEEQNNYQRLVRVPLNLQTRAIRFIPEETWGADKARVFAFEPLDKMIKQSAPVEDGPAFATLRSRILPADLDPPARLSSGEPLRTDHAA